MVDGQHGRNGAVAAHPVATVGGFDKDHVRIPSPGMAVGLALVRESKLSFVDIVPVSFDMRISA